MSRHVTRREAALAIAAAASLGLVPHWAGAAETLASARARALADQAYVYGFPLVDLYRILWNSFADNGGLEYKAPPNTLYNTSNLYTPGDTTVRMPNADTLSSFALFDLRAEPWVLTLPAIEAKRYYSVQIVDLYTYNAAYLGTRPTGNGGGNFLLAGPGWNGTAPDGIASVINADTGFALALYRTQLFDDADIESVKAIQSQYAIAPLSAFAGSAAPAPAPSIAWIAPIPAIDERTSPGFFNILAWMLQYCPPFPGEIALRNRFKALGIVPGTPFDPAALAPQVRTALAAGMADGQKRIDAARSAATNSAAYFGSRQQLGENYLARAAAAQLGILGDAPAEVTSFTYQADERQERLSGAHAYTLTFAAGQLPPVRAFWSLTMYDVPQQRLVANKLGRYLINSPMLPTLHTGADGSLTLYLSNASPGKDQESNWLPAPDGPFFCVLRCYCPASSVLDGTWKIPPLVKAP